MKPKPSFDLPTELIEQYKVALARVSDDLRLVVLLVFNAFEEVMKAIAAWRLSCNVNDLPKSLTRSASQLFDLVLTADKSGKVLRDQAQQLSELRNDVAHGFHKRKYKAKLGAFVESVSGKPWPSLKAKRQKEFIDAVTTLALNIAVHVSDNVDERGEFPVPQLSLELGDLARKS